MGFGQFFGIGPAEAEVEGRDAHLDEGGIVFGGGDGSGCNYVVFSEGGFENATQAIGEGGIVVDGVSEFVVLD